MIKFIDSPHDEERCALCDYPITTLLDVYNIGPYIVHALCWHIDERRWWEGELDRIYDRQDEKIKN